MATLDELDTILSANAGYRAADSLSMAETYETALLEYMRINPESAANQSSSMSHDGSKLQMLLDRVTAFIAQKKAELASTNSNARTRILHPSAGWRR